MRPVATFSGFDVKDKILRGLAVVLTFACSGTLLHAQARKQNESTKGKQISDIFRDGLPSGLIQFDVPNPAGSLKESTPRLAVLDGSGLRIYRSDGASKLTQEFALPNPPNGDSWDTLEEFPGRDALPGVVVWASPGVGYALGAVVCYVNGEPQVVFRGQFFDFAHITRDDIPQILVEQGLGFEGTGPAKSVIVWAWNGRRYVKVEEVPVDRLYSQDVVKAIRAAQERK